MEESKHQKLIHWRKSIKIALGLLLGYSFWFCLLILALRWINPPFTAFTLQEDWDSLGMERYSLRETWVKGEELPDHLKLAVIASEDQRFYDHWGLDMNAIGAALEEKKQRGRVRGASTITQQVAKNLFLTSSQTYLRKIIEAGIAVLIDFLWPKERILEVYFNVAEFGPGMYGISTASAFYYGKQPKQLTPVESARMATVLPNPALIEPEPPSEYVLNRSRWILRNMEQLSGDQYLPKSKPDTTDTVQIQRVELDTLKGFNYQDSLNNFLDSLLLNNEWND